jgi:uncharacterized membrane protein
MTDAYVQPPAPPPPPASPMADERQTALIVYILMLVPFVVFVTHVVGLVIAYVSRDTAPDWLKSHYTYQINTFWMGLLYMVVACFLCLILIGFLLVPLVVVWYIVRCALGLARLMRNEPYPNPGTWTF